MCIDASGDCFSFISTCNAHWILYHFFPEFIDFASVWKQHYLSVCQFGIIGTFTFTSDGSLYLPLLMCMDACGNGFQSVLIKPMGEHTVFLKNKFRQFSES